MTEGFVHKLYHNVSVHDEQIHSRERAVERNGKTSVQDTTNVGKQAKNESVRSTGKQKQKGTGWS